MRCPLCKERIKWKAVKCHFCGTIVDKKTEGLQFIKTGFEKIEAECKALEKQVSMRCGFIIRWHMFSEEKLLSFIEKIESHAHKIRSDIESWKDSKKPDTRISLFYNESAKKLYTRLEELQEMIWLRKPTVWEHIGSFFKAFYFHIVEKLLPLITGRASLGFKKQNRIPAEI